MRCILQRRERETDRGARGRDQNIETEGESEWVRGGRHKYMATASIGLAVEA